MSHGPCSFMSTGVAPLAGSDHQLIFLTQDIATGVKSSTSMCREVRSFRKCNVNSLLDDLSNAPCSTMDVFDTVDDKRSYWKTLFLKVVNKHAPIIRIQTRTKQHGYHWVSEETRRLMQSRNYRLNKFRKRRDPADWHAF